MILKGEEILFLFSNSIVSKKLKECNKFPHSFVMKTIPLDSLFLILAHNLIF